MAIIFVSLANCMLLASLALFGSGFFPYKPHLPGLAQYEDTSFGPPPQAPFDKLVFMVVDALRSDFVYAEGSGFNFTHQLIREGAAVPFTANARSPTVTMPRLKALTTGSIPSFLDVVLNVFEGDKSSSLTNQDNWLMQMRAKDTGKMIMFGDDTWIKLFPGTFDRSDGTTSFFVADFTIVDNNVTRHIPKELKNNDWNTMILHYLGLDHIGHKSGPNSVNMFPKQTEMDGIIKQIYSALETEPHMSSTLFVFCGDHGMNEAGNHGASSAGETSPALVFVSPKFKSLPSAPLSAPLPHVNNFRYFDYVEQSDLVPTLASLLGFPIPKNSLGVTIPKFLSMWEKTEDKAQLLGHNANQILGLVTAAFGSERFVHTNQDTCDLVGFSVNDLACRWQKLIKQDLAKNIDDKWEAEFIDWLRTAQDLMSSMASNLNAAIIVLGIFFGTCSVILTQIALIVGTGTGHSSSSSQIFIYVVSLSYGAMIFASSFVEEEQHFWYWALSTSMPFIGRHMRLSKQNVWVMTFQWTTTTMALLRIMRGYNQTGQKFAGDPDIVSRFIKTDPMVLWSLILITFFVIYYQITRFVQMEKPISLLESSGKSAIAIMISFVFFFKLGITETDSPELNSRVWMNYFSGMVEGVSMIWLARVSFVAIAILACGALAYRGKRERSLALHHVLTLFLIMQTRVTNIPLFLVMETLFLFFRNIYMPAAEITIITLMLQYASFFAFGGTNAISSIDISSGYNGVSDFNIFAVGILTFATNCAGPIYWASACGVMLARLQNGSVKPVLSAFTQHTIIASYFISVSTTLVMVACWVMKNHLFIWTVFSPKFLYCIGWYIAHIVLNIGLTGGFYMLGGQFQQLGR